MPQSGYIYILINPTLNGLVKIGKTSKTSEERAKELSSATGVPTQFIVAYDKFFEDIDLAENHVNEVIKNMGHHVFPNKEFFDIPLKEAINIVKNTKVNFKNLLTEDSDAIKVTDEYEENKSPYSDLMEEAQNYFYGLGDYIRDAEKAVELYKEAATLGSGEACYQLGYILNFGIYFKINKRDALKILKLGTEYNYPKCYLLMAEIYFDLHQPDNSEKCINEYFEKLKNLEDKDRLNLLEDYISSQIENNRKIDIEKIKDYIQELIIYFEDNIQYSINRLDKYKLTHNEGLIEWKKETLEKNIVILEILKKI